MTKIDKENLIFLKIAFNIAEFSHCISKKVGCIIVKDRRILSTGCNGTPSGYINCDDYFRDKKLNLNIKEDRDIHSSWSTDNEVHAELNALLYCSKYGITVNNAKMYITLTPCRQCLKNIIQSGINEIIYANDYDKLTYNIKTDSLANKIKIYKASDEVINNL